MFEPHVCPQCGGARNQTFHDRRVTDAQPGDPSACWICGSISQFDKDLRLKTATAAVVAQWQITHRLSLIAAVKISKEAQAKRMTPRPT